MGDGSQLFEIIIFAAIAGFLVLKLRSVLGRRTGHERPPPADPFAPPRPEPAAEKVVALPARPRATPLPAADSVAASATGIAARIKAADPRFEEVEFLTGARGAFEMIVNAFASGDTATLQPLLSPSVYASFAEAIRQRLAAREKLEVTLLSIKAAELAEAEVEGDTLLVTVKFVSDQINAMRGADGAVIDGNPDLVVEHTDLWTFSRPVRSRDPNWILIATRSP